MTRLVVEFGTDDRGMEGASLLPGVRTTWRAAVLYVCPACLRGDRERASSGPFWDLPFACCVQAGPGETSLRACAAAALPADSEERRVKSGGLRGGSCDLFRVSTSSASVAFSPGPWETSSLASLVLPHFPGTGGKNTTT